MSWGDKLNESEAINSLIEELKEQGYPLDAIRQEFAVTYESGQRRYADVAIIDPGTNDVVAVIEVKGGSQRNSLNMAARQVASYAKQLPSSPQALAYAFEDGERKIALVGDSSNEIRLLSNFPSYASLVTGGRAQGKVEVKSKSNKVSGRFSSICHLLALLVLIVLILDIADIYRFTSQQLTLLGIFIGLFIIPYAAKFKLLGMEFERYGDAKSKST